ncbi:Uncharacterized protein dnm_047030 [Desulfonema magnum]|uniref:Uncharacterized protein n=1 Tax=Desulfonema magnum TaxID=45655 RepID=A0A975BND2_9BACT|nr:Uncharacterized protein dnm_047030 [Desulfonema magnum]
MVTQFNAINAYEKAGFFAPVMKMFSDRKPGFSKCIFTVNDNKITMRDN